MATLSSVWSESPFGGDGGRRAHPCGTSSPHRRQGGLRQQQEQLEPQWKRQYAQLTGSPSYERSRRWTGDPADRTSAVRGPQGGNGYLGAVQGEFEASQLTARLGAQLSAMDDNVETLAAAAEATGGHSRGSRSVSPLQLFGPFSIPPPSSVGFGGVGFGLPLPPPPAAGTGGGLDRILQSLEHGQRSVRDAVGDLERIAASPGAAHHNFGPELGSPYSLASSGSPVSPGHGKAGTWPASFLARMLVGLGTRVVDWSAKLDRPVLQSELLQLVLEYVEPCAYLDPGIDELRTKLEGRSPKALSLATTVGNLDYNKLTKNHSMRASFESAVKTGVASWTKITPSDVTLKLAPGSVKVTATVRAEALANVAATVDFKGLGAKLATIVAAVPGISIYKESQAGKITVGDPVVVPVVPPPPPKMPVDGDEEAAALKIQAIKRGKDGRKEAEKRKAGFAPPPPPKMPVDGDEEAAALKIQAIKRGKDGRKEAEKRKAAKGSATSSPSEPLPKSTERPPAPVPPSRPSERAQEEENVSDNYVRAQLDPDAIRVAPVVTTMSLQRSKKATNLDDMDGHDNPAPMGKFKSLPRSNKAVNLDLLDSYQGAMGKSKSAAPGPPRRASLEQRPPQPGPPPRRSVNQGQPSTGGGQVEATF